MHRLTYHVTTLSPALFAVNVGDTNMVSTRDYIPGTVIMGLFAQKYIHDRHLGDDAHIDKNFYPWFLQGALRFSNAYITTDAGIDSIWRNFPLPVSIHHKKGDKSTVYDLLWLKNEDETQTRGIEGFGRLDGNGLSVQPVQKSLNFHHQRDPETGTVQKGLIFNYEALDAHQTFEGDITGDKGALEQIRTMFGKEQVVSIGRSKSAQYGKVRLQFLSDAPEDAVTATIDASSINNNMISLTLRSNTIIYHNHGFSTTKKEDFIRELQNTLGEGIAIEHSFVRTDEVENFVSVWRLRRPSEVCFKAGSCFLLNGITPEIIPHLMNLQYQGIGMRRGEGFGEIVFGWQREEKPEFLETREKRKNLPGSQGADIPGQTREMVLSVVQDLIRKKVESEAILSALEFDPFRAISSSLIGRLAAMANHLRRDEFRNAMKNTLRATAREKLEGCNNGQTTLFEFLQGKEITAGKLVQQLHNLKVSNLCKTIKYDYERDGEFKAALFRTYFQTFFSTIRKKLKETKETVKHE